MCSLEKPSSLGDRLPPPRCSAMPREADHAEPSTSVHLPGAAIASFLWIATPCRSRALGAAVRDALARDRSLATGAGHPVCGECLQRILLEREHVLGDYAIRPFAGLGLGIELLVGEAHERTDEPRALCQPLRDQPLHRR